MICPSCGQGTTVTDSRIEDGARMRTRKCLSCGCRCKTVERRVEDDLVYALQRAHDRLRRIEEIVRHGP